MKYFWRAGRTPCRKSEETKQDIILCVNVKLELFAQINWLLPENYTLTLLPVSVLQLVRSC